MTYKKIDIVNLLIKENRCKRAYVSYLHRLHIGQLRYAYIHNNEIRARMLAYELIDKETTKEEFEEYMRLKNGK